MALFDIRTHNGKITIVSNRTGDHRTVKIATVKAGKLAGKRIASLLIGPNNCLDYKGFGFVNTNGSITLWNSCKRDKFFLVLAHMISAPEHYLEKAKFMFEGKCIICNKPLTHPLSIELGIGPECRKKAN